MNNTEDRIAALMSSGEGLHAQHGTDVRCPTCNAGAGKFCRDADGNRVMHAERVARSLEAKNI